MKIRYLFVVLCAFLSFRVARAERPLSYGIQLAGYAPWSFDRWVGSRTPDLRRMTFKTDGGAMPGLFGSLRLSNAAFLNAGFNVTRVHYRVERSRVSTDFRYWSYQANVMIEERLFTGRRIALATGINLDYQTNPLIQAAPGDKVLASRQRPVVPGFIASLTVYPRMADENWSLGYTYVRSDYSKNTYTFSNESGKEVFYNSAHRSVFHCLWIRYLISE